MFATLASLNTHLISSAHRRLSVICPWCVEKEKTYTRVHDLEVHVRAAHEEVDASKEKFTRANGFYFALYPEDYARIVDRIEPYKSDVAFYARSAIRKWAEGFKDVQIRTHNWNTGWKAGVEISEKKARGSTDRDSRKVVRSRSRSRDGEDNVKEGHSKSYSNSADASNARDRAGSSDGRKVGIGGRSDKVDERGDGHSKGLKDSRTGKSTKTAEESKQLTSKVGERCSKGACSSSDGYVERDEQVEKDSGDSTGEKVTSDKTVKDRGKHSEIRRSIGVDKVSREPGGDKTDQMSEYRKRDRSAEGESRTVKARKHGGDGDRDDDVESGSFENYKDNIELGEDAAAGEKTNRKERSPSPSSSSSSSGSDTSVACNDGLQGRAQAILKKGCMPVCMPARRDWSRVTEFSLAAFGAEFHWPPENWREMSPDQRLLAHEFISQFLEMTLETRASGKRYPLISRRALLDKYNFMALEGEAKPRDEASAGDRTDGKIRYYNYSYLKTIAKGEVSDTRMSSSMVASMEGASRWKDTDSIISKLDQEGVKIMM